MNKIAKYLNQHLLGEVSAAKSVRNAYSTDGSILTLTPEMVIFPRVTNDIRKVARFTWQLAEKGHAMPVTARGGGSNTTGSALSKGMILDSRVYLNSILTVAQKEKLAHVQAGASLESVQAAVKWQGLTLPVVNGRQTVGGAIASASCGDRDHMDSVVDKLEVVLANGDVIETGRKSRHEVNKILGHQTFEGEVYRKLSALIEDNVDLVNRLEGAMADDSVGYPGISSVRRRDGSMDLTPLFVGSQGTLGIISEAVLKLDFFNPNRLAAAITASSIEQGRDLIDKLYDYNPAQLYLVDGSLIERAQSYDKTLSIIGDSQTSAAVVVVSFDDHSDRNRLHKFKRMMKYLKTLNLPVVDSRQHDLTGFDQLIDLPKSLARLAEDGEQSPPAFDCVHVPVDRREEFASRVIETADKLHVAMPVVVNGLTGCMTFYPQLKLSSVGDKQKIFKILKELNDHAVHHEGTIGSCGAEGRLKAPVAWASLDKEVVELYESIRQIFDPFGTMNPGVKQPVDPRTLVSMLRKSFEASDNIA
ncbi:hypothetical protein B7Y94_03830 [Candidatus Saccharibacteria bacterium 32-49-12]|nr:MAG: hypothetical protein B7Y94_03830 [Candidatus Saccharibacteria bacterium 32-49-12]